MIVVPCRGRSSLRATGMPDCRSPREQLHRIDQLARTDSADTDLPDRLVVRMHQLLTTKCLVVVDTVLVSLYYCSGSTELHRFILLLLQGRSYHISHNRPSVNLYSNIDIETQYCKPN